MSRNDDSKSNQAGDSFASLMSSTKVLKTDKVAPYQKKIDPKPRMRMANEMHAMEELLDLDDEETSFESGDTLKFVRDGYSPRLLKQLRRGDFPIQDELDLHGLFTDEAKLEVHAFINDCAQSKLGTVRIIHGKGLHSQGGKPVIKNLILGWLRHNENVIAVCSAHKNDGSTGAVYVLIRTN